MSNPTPENQLTSLQEWLGTGAINIFGLPFAGKDSQGSRLAEALGVPLIGGGDILRNSVIPERVKAIMHRGELIPIEDYLSIVLPYLSQDNLSGQPLVLSSVGRWHGEEPGVIEALTQADHPLRAVIYLQLDERTVWRRWEALEGHHERGKRHDDAAESLEVRIEEFRVKTMPVIDFYRDLGLLIEVDTSLPKEEVYEAILTRLTERTTNNQD